jgi:alkylation response protein AidB-like acyl-CoA dehydrogenase
MVLLCPDPQVLGAPFYLMSHVSGRLMLMYAGRELSAFDGPARSPLAVPGHPGTDELADRYAARSGRDVGDLDPLGVRDDRAGGGVLRRTNIATRIERRGDEYVINGRKWFVTGAMNSDARSSS